ncbi:MAG: tRNA dihydrouridine(20/20a) synthase DusA [Alphaproteobacteria bacterium]|nr:tRNA dihydrouridine(20/20a) synthase DusA [Alphaproteobacteria bacterium]MDP6813649.1 tRNA dihydrouridine(20/20a) synthase DusA [Alphaproteobacteria bacterium]
MSLGAPDHRFCVAPMMEWTDRHDRYFLRLLTRRALLYSEMVTAEAVIHGDRERLLGFAPEEHPVALQLGGADPGQMARAAEAAEQFGYDEVNINVGCPSDRVQSGRFGACLMAEPDTVAACVRAMRGAVGLPITVKSRIGIDDSDSFDFLAGFVETVARAGCRSFIVHARKAMLKGLSPKQNRDIPPLDHDRVYRLKRHFPELEIIVNGGIRDLDQAAAHLAEVDGVMLGRAAYQTPYLLGRVDSRFFDAAPAGLSRHDVVAAMYPYIEAQLAAGVRLQAITRHILGLFHGQPGARAWRRHLSLHAPRPGAGLEVVREALAKLPDPDKQSGQLSSRPATALSTGQAGLDSPR